MCIRDRCVITGLGKRCGIAAVPNAGLCNAHHAFRHLRGHADRPLLVDLEGHQVALVHTDEITPDNESPFQLAFVVNLDQGIETHLLGERMEVAQLCIVEGGSDQQDTVGAHESGIDHIAGVDREVLSDDRQRDRCTGRLEILHRPTEPVDIGENRQTRRSPRLVGAGERGGIEVGEEIALARGAPLDLADHGDRIRSGQRRPKAPRRRQARTLLDERVEGSGVRSRRRPVCLEDPVEIGLGQGYRPLPAAGVSMTSSGAPAMTAPRAPISAFMASEPLCTARASPSAYSS